jgi:hypothetical protein
MLLAPVATIHTHSLKVATFSSTWGSFIHIFDKLGPYN